MNDSNLLKTLYILIVTSIILIFFATLSTDGNKVPIFDEKVTLFNEGWIYENSSGMDTPITLPTTLDLPANSIVRLSNTLPDIYIEGMSINIFTSLQTLRVFIENNQIYEYGFSNSKPISPLSLNSFHLIRLPSDTIGKEITLEITSPYASKIGEIEEITLGSKSANIAYIIKNHLLSFIVCNLTFLLGIALIIMFIYINRRFKESKSLLYLGLFSVIVSVWSITETRMLQFIFPNPIFEYMIAYLSIMLCPIPFLLYLKGATHSSKYKKINWTCNFIIINFILTNVFYFTGIADYRTMLPTTHFFLFVTISISLYNIIKEIFYFKNKEAYHLGISILILGITIIIDMFRYFILNSTDAALFTRIGLLLFIMIVGISTVLKLSKVLEMGFNARAIHRLAYTDPLTNVYNRRAYVRDIDEINATLSEKSNIVVIMCDLNNLKLTNDTHGHEAGDMLIMAAANCIQQSISKYGTCYRIGGDEYAAILQNIKDSTLQDLLNKLKESVDLYNQSNPVKLEIPFGYTHFDPTLDKDLYATFIRADRLMYKEKARMKNSSEYAVINTN